MANDTQTARTSKRKKQMDEDRVEQGKRYAKLIAKACQG